MRRRRGERLRRPQGCADAGLAAGDRVAIFAKNSPEYVEALFAISHAEPVAVPVNNKLHAGEVAFILEHSDSRLVLGSGELTATIAAANRAVCRRSHCDSVRSRF